MPDTNNDLKHLSRKELGTNFSGFMGQNYKGGFKSQLIDVIDYGWFTFITKTNVHCFFNFTRIYWKLGLDLFVFTILIKLVLYIGSYKRYDEYAKIKDLA